MKRDVADSEFKKGERVTDEYLGVGTVEENIGEGFAYVVVFDEAPHIRYNGGERRCLRFSETLTKAQNDGG